MADPLATRSTIFGALAALLLTAVPAPAAGQRAPTSPVDSLVALGRLQEAAWAARVEGDTARSEVLLQLLETLLRSPPHRMDPLGLDSQGVSYTYHLHHAGGVESIFKVDGSDVFCRACGTDREVASYRLDRLLGLDLTPMVVEATVVDAAGDTLSGSAMYFVRGAMEPAEVGASKPDALRFFDAVIGNSDRHPENWLVMADGRPVAIDHNRAFQYRPGAGARTCWETEVDSIASPGSLGRPLERLRALPDDSLAAAVAGLDPELVDRFVAMRRRVVERISARAEKPPRAPARAPPLEDCRRPSDTG